MRDSSYLVGETQIPIFLTENRYSVNSGAQWADLMRRRFSLLRNRPHQLSEREDAHQYLQKVIQTLGRLL